MERSSTRPLVFLDVDGVLNRTGSRAQTDTELPLAQWLERPLVDALSGLLAASGAQVVLCSSWRNRPPSEIVASFSVRGCALPLVGVTPSLSGQPRWKEIAAWLAQAPLPPRSFVILDDEWTMGPLDEHHVRLSSRSGLDAYGVAAAMKVLAVPSA